MADEPDFSGPGPWTLPVQGFVVETLDFSLPFEMAARDPASSRQFKVQLGLPFVFADQAGRQRDVVIDGVWVLDDVRAETIFYFGPDEDEDFPPARLAPLRALEGDVIDYATVWPTSALHVEMWSGRSITSGSDFAPEAWEVTGHGFHLVGVDRGPVIYTGEAWER